VGDLTLSPKNNGAILERQYKENQKKKNCKKMKKKIVNEEARKNIQMQLKTT